MHTLIKRLTAAKHLRTALLAIAAGGAVLAAPPAQAQAKFPARPIHLVVPYPPGGGTDVVSRLIADPLAQAAGQPVIVENKGGANGIVGCQYVESAAPDGYTILLVLPAQMAVNPALIKNLGYDPVRGFVPIIQLTSFEVALVVHPSLPVNNVKALVALAKAKPGALHLASAGTGSSGHMAAVWFAMKTGVDWVHVPYKGAGPAFTDLLGGQEEVMFSTTLSALPYVRDGRLRALGTTGLKRSLAAPEIPAIAESIPGYEFTQWHGLVAPAKTPPEIVARLNADIAGVLRQTQVKDKLATLDAEAVGGSPADFARTIQADIGRYAGIVKVSGMKAE
ncbi:MAG TPA: tripartite tricarboxylate transporter substrate binding protein [Burkholderiales bacterium]|nr:tripartite tricarboxylate transporter substrate binding protein [Burkholderiales bacterium]